MAPPFVAASLLVLGALLTESLPVLGQAIPAYASATSADEWMARVSQLPLRKQVAAIRARVLSDTVLRHPRQYVCLMPLSAAAREAYHRAQEPRTRAEMARPVGDLLLYQVDNYILATNYPAQATAFLQQLDAKHIHHITYLPGGAGAAAIYGARGANGAVVLSSKKAQRP
jgi:hypothetical protein